MEANIAHYCLHKLHRWPHEFLALDRYEKAMVIASVEVKLKNDREAEKKAKLKGKRK